MAGHRVDGVVEGDDFPGDVGIGRNGLLHKGLVLSCGAVVAVEHQKEHVVVGKPVVATGIGCPFFGFVGDVKVLAIGIAGGVVVANHRGHREIQKFLMVEVAVVLFLIAGGVDLIASGEQEVYVGKVLIGRDNAQGLVPALDIAGGAACADLGVAGQGEGECAGVAGGKGVDFTLVLAVHQLIGVFAVRFEVGDGGLVGVLAFLIGWGGGGRKRRGIGGHLSAGHVADFCHQYLAGYSVGGVPGEVALCLVCANGQADVAELLHLRGDIFLFGQGEIGEQEPGVGAGRAILVHDHGDGVFSLVQQLHAGGEGLCHGVAAGMSGVLEVLGDACVIPTGHTGTIDVDGGAVIDLHSALELLHGCKLVFRHGEGGAEKVGEGVIFTVAAGQNGIGHKAAA